MPLSVPSREASPDKACLLRSFSAFLDLFRDDVECHTQRRFDHSNESEQQPSLVDTVVSRWKGSDGASNEALMLMPQVDNSSTSLSAVENMLFLFSSEEDEELLVRQLWSAFRHRCIRECAFALVRRIQTLRPCENVSLDEFHASLRDLSSSQLTREQLLYPLRHMLPQGVLHCCDYARGVFADVFCDMESWSTPREGIQSMERLVDEVAGEMLCSSTPVLPRSFPMFQVGVDLFVSFAFVHLRCMCHEGWQEASESGGSVLTRRVGQLKQWLQSRLYLLLVGSEACEVHWLYSQAVVTAHIRAEGNAAPLQRPLSISLTSPKTLYSSVVGVFGSALLEWLSGEQHLSSLAAVTGPHPVSLSGLWAKARTSGRGASAKEGTHGQDHCRSLHRLLSVVDSELQCPVTHDIMCDDETRTAAVSALLPSIDVLWVHSTQEDALEALRTSLHELVVQEWNTSGAQRPSWLTEDNSRDISSFFATFGWSQEVFGKPEFRSLANDQGHHASLLVASLHQAVSAYLRSTPPQQQPSVVQIFQSCGYRLIKCIAGLCLVYPHHCTQLPLEDQMIYMHNLIQLHLKDFLASPSQDVFDDVTAYDVMVELLRTVLPLDWSAGSVKRGDELWGTLKMRGALHLVCGPIAVLWLQAVGRAVMEGVVKLRNSYEEALAQRHANDKYWRDPTFMTIEDYSIFSGFLHHVAELLSLCVDTAKAAIRSDAKEISSFGEEIEEGDCGGEFASVAFRSTAMFDQHGSTPSAFAPNISNNSSGSGGAHSAAESSCSSKVFPNASLCSMWVSLLSSVFAVVPEDTTDDTDVSETMDSICGSSLGTILRTYLVDHRCATPTVLEGCVSILEGCVAAPSDHRALSSRSGAISPRIKLRQPIAATSLWEAVTNLQRAEVVVGSRATVLEQRLLELWEQLQSIITYFD